MRSVLWGGFPEVCPWPARARRSVGAHLHTRDMELPTAIAVVIAVISLLLNIAAVLISRSQVAAARSQTEVQRQIHRDSSQPYVWADIRPNPAQGVMLDLVLGNSGPTVATAITVTFSPPFEDLRELSSAALGRLSEGVASLPPGRTITWTLGKSAELVASIEPQPRTITVDATGPFGALTQLEYVIDMTDVRESNDRPEGSLHLLSKAVDRRPSVKDVAALTGALQRLAEQRADDSSTDD